jgi:hypothetical protein
MDTMTANFLANRNIPDVVSLRILDFSRPTSLSKTHKNEVELMGTFKAFKHLSLYCDEMWEEYYKAWNSRRTPGYTHLDEPEPPHIWTLIEHDLVKKDKNTAEYYMKNLKIICESPELLEKVSNYERVMWDYQSKTQKYKRVVRNYPAEETMKDLVSYIECLRTTIEHIEQDERYNESYHQQDEEFLEQMSTHEGYLEWMYG